MIGAIYIFNYKGDVINDHIYRQDIKKSHADMFRVNVIHSRHLIKSPVVTISGVIYCYIKKLGYWIVAITNHNSNVAMTFQFLHNILSFFEQCLHPFTPDKFDSKTHFISIILSEVCDNGVPQLTDPASLLSILNYSNLKITTKAEQSKLTVQVTGQIGWRKNDITHRRHELFLDIKEQVHCLMSNNGEVLTSHVIGSVQMRSTLSGMPECSLGINDKIVNSRSQSSKNSTKSKKLVAIDDCTFHQCVRLSKYESDQSITFIPPDGSFELMSYRTTKDIILPFRVTPIHRELDKNTTEITVVLKSTFSAKSYATKIAVSIPLSKRTAKVVLKTTKGKSKYKRGDDSIVWSVKKMCGMQEYHLIAVVSVMEGARKEGNKNISVSFKMEHPFSGMKIHYLRIIEPRMNYSERDVTKWVRYQARNGLYEIRCDLA